MDIKKVIATTVASSMMITSVVSFANNVSAYRLPAKYTDVSIKLSGLTEEHLKKVPLSMVLDNMTYASDVYAEENSEPAASEGENSEPITSEGENSEPITSEGENSEPTTSDDENSEPTTSDDENSEPTTSDDENSEPTTSDDENSEPTTSDDENSEPTTSDDENSEPTTSEDENSEPTTSDDENSEPTTSDDENSEPTTSEDETSEPTTSDDENSEPTTSDDENSEPMTSEDENSEPTTSEDETSEPADSDDNETENVEVNNEQQNGELVVDVSAGDPIETETEREIIHRKDDKVEFSADAAYIRIDDTVYSLSDETVTIDLFEPNSPDEYVLVKEIIVSSDDVFDSEDECFIASFFITKNFWSFDEFRFYTENENEEKVYLKTQPGKELDNSVAFTVFSPLERGKNIYLEAVPQLIWNDTVRGDVDIEVTYHGTSVKAENILENNRIMLDLRAFDEEGSLVTEQYGITIALAEEVFTISADIVNYDAFENVENTISMSDSKSKLPNAAEFGVNFDVASLNSEFLLKIYKLGLLRADKEIGEADILGAYLGRFTSLDEITEETPNIAAELFGGGIITAGTEITLFIDSSSVSELVTVDAEAFILNITFNINVREPNINEPDTSEPTTSDTETSEPVTSEPETSEPTTSKPETSEPTASKPETSEPTTSKPETSEPTTSKPETSEPTTSKPETSEPTASKPETSEPTTSKPETSEPTTSKPETSEPTTSKPETSEPTTSKPETSEPTTSKPETSEPTTSKPETSEPTTSKPETSEPTTSKPETSEPITSEPETSEPVTSDPETSEPVTSDPETSEPVTSDPETSKPITSEPETSEPVTSEPETSEPEAPKPVPVTKLWSGFGSSHSIFFNNLKEAYCELVFAYSGELNDLEVDLINADNIALGNVEVISGEAADEILAKYEAFKNVVIAGESVEITALSAEGLEDFVEFNNSELPGEPENSTEPGEIVENNEYGVIIVRIDPVKDGYGRLFNGSISGMLSVSAANAEPLEITLDGSVDVLQITRRVTGVTPVKFIPYNAEFMMSGDVDYVSAEFSANGLPNGLYINKKTGMISGIPEKSGEFTVEISARITFTDEDGELQTTVITREAKFDVSVNSARNLHMNSDPNYAIDEFLGDSFDGRTYYLDEDDIAQSLEIILKGDVAEFVDLWINGEKIKRVSDDYKTKHGTTSIIFSENALANFEKDEIYTIVFAFRSAENDRMIYAAQNFSIVEDKASVPVTVLDPDDYKDVYTPANRLDKSLDRELADVLGSVKLYTEQNAFEYGRRLVVKPYSTEFDYPTMTIKMVDENGAPVESNSEMTVGIALPESYEDGFYLYRITNGIFEPINFIDIKDGRLFFALDMTESYAVSKTQLNAIGDEFDANAGTIVSGASAVRSFSDENPVTGIAVSGAGIVVSGTALGLILLTGRRRKKDTKNTK